MKEIPFSENLNPKKCKIVDPRKENYQQVPDMQDELPELNMNGHGYYEALPISSYNHFQIHFKRQSNARFINNHFVEGLQAWKANIDVHLVLNHQKAVTYMCAYFSKADNETSEVMKQAAKEASASRKSNFEKMRAIARAYSTKRESSVQEKAYLVMPELWSQKTFPNVIFEPTSLGEKGSYDFTTVSMSVGQ